MARLVRFTSDFLQAGDDRNDHRNPRPIMQSPPDPLEDELVKPLTYTETKHGISRLPKTLTRTLTIPADIRADPEAQELLRTILIQVKHLRQAKSIPV